MKPKVERLDNIENIELGEGPHWDEESQSLYFVDVIKQSIFKYVPATNKCTKAVIGLGIVSLIIPVRGQKDKFLVTVDRELKLVTWDGISDKVSYIQTVYEVDNNEDTLDNNLNDGKCDSTGRLWAGSMGGRESNGREIKKEKGSLFSFEKNKVRKHVSKIGISNGLAFNDKLKKFYYIDSMKGRVEAYDFDIKNGTIDNGTTIFTLSKHDIPGEPDGMTIDTDGNLWVAIFMGQRVLKIDPRNPETLLDTIPIPAKQITSVTFGGSNLDEIYVTSGRIVALAEGEDLSPPDHGATFRITGVNAKGYPGVSVVL